MNTKRKNRKLNDVKEFIVFLRQGRTQNRFPPEVDYQKPNLPRLQLVFKQGSVEEVANENDVFASSQS